MPRRVSLPGAAELFGAGATEHVAPAADPDPSEAADPDAGAGATTAPQTVADRADPAPDQLNEVRVVDEPEAEESGVDQPETRQPGAGGGTGRVKHEEKITVYISSDELLNLERTRLSLRAEHGMAVDRGRIVREALALVLGDFGENGVDSQLVGRLSQP